MNHENVMNMNITMCMGSHSNIHFISYDTYVHCVQKIKKIFIRPYVRLILYICHHIVSRFFVLHLTNIFVGLRGWWAWPRCPKYQLPVKSLIFISSWLRSRSISQTFDLLKEPKIVVLVITYVNLMSVWICYLLLHFIVNKKILLFISYNTADILTGFFSIRVRHSILINQMILRQSFWEILAGYLQWNSFCASFCSVFLCDNLVKIILHTCRYQYCTYT